MTEQLNWTEYVIFVFLFLTSLCIAGSRFIHLTTTNIPLYICTHIFFFHSFVDGHLSCFHVLDVLNSAAVNIGVHVSFWIKTFSGYMILVFWMLSFKPAFSLYCFTIIKRLISSSFLSAIRVVSPAYLRLLIFLLAILIPACASSSSAFHMMSFAVQ